jgi:hypothetical protein
MSMLILAANHQNVNNGYRRFAWRVAAGGKKTAENTSLERKKYLPPLFKPQLIANIP